MAAGIQRKPDRRHWGRKVHGARSRRHEQIRATVSTEEALHDRDYNPEVAQTANLSVLASTLGIVLLGERLIDGQIDVEEALAEIVSPGEELDPSTLLDDALANGR